MSRAERPSARGASAVGIGRIVRRSVVSWFKDDSPSMGAAIAFYMLFAIAPSMLIAIRFAGAFIGVDVVQAHILSQLSALLGENGIVAYLGRASLHSVYGIAGSFLVLLLWVYYSAQILLLGAQFTCQYTYGRGSRSARAKNAATSSGSSP